MFANLMTLVVVGELMGLPVTHDDGDGVGVATQPFNYTIWAQDKPRKAPAARAGKPKVTCSYQRWWYAHGLQKVGREYADPDRPLSTEPVKKGCLVRGQMLQRVPEDCLDREQSCT